MAYVGDVRVELGGQVRNGRAIRQPYDNSAANEWPFQRSHEEPSGAGRRWGPFLLYGDKISCKIVHRLRIDIAFSELRRQLPGTEKLHIFQKFVKTGSSVTPSTSGSPHLAGDEYRSTCDPVGRIGTAISTLLLVHATHARPGHSPRRKRIVVDETQLHRPAPRRL